MPLFKKRTKTVDAEQWFPGKDVRGVFLHRPPDAVIGGRGPGEQRFPQDPYPAVRTIQGQIVRVTPGDWIILESDGVHYYPCAADEFLVGYDPA